MKLLVGIDTETTTAHPETAELLQIGAAAFHVDTGVINVIMNALCRPTSNEIPEDASNIHGIYMEQLIYKPYDQMVAWQLGLMLKDIVSETTPCLVTYNGESFDLPILHRYGILTDIPHIDVYRIVQRQLWPHGLKLTEVYESYVGQELDEAHDAVPDILATIAILNKFRLESKMSIEEVVNWLREPIILTICPFGKHKGIPFSDIPRGYLRWCKENWGNPSPDLAHTLDFYLQ